METKLVEGVVVRSEKFINGIFEDGRLFVGDYIENSIFDFSDGVRENDFSRAYKKYVIISCWEMDPIIVNGNRVNTYENRFVAKELNADDTYNENGEEIIFSTAGTYRGSINEVEIDVIKVMKKVFV